VHSRRAIVPPCCPTAPLYPLPATVSGRKFPSWAPPQPAVDGICRCGRGERRQRDRGGRRFACPPPGCQTMRRAENWLIQCARSAPGSRAVLDRLLADARAAGIGQNWARPEPSTEEEERKARRTRQTVRASVVLRNGARSRLKQRPDDEACDDEPATMRGRRREAGAAAHQPVRQHRGAPKTPSSGRTPPLRISRLGASGGCSEEAEETALSASPWRPKTSIEVMSLRGTVGLACSAVLLTGGTGARQRMLSGLQTSEENRVWPEKAAPLLGYLALKETVAREAAMPGEGHANCSEVSAVEPEEGSTQERRGQVTAARIAYNSGCRATCGDARTLNAAELITEAGWGLPGPAQQRAAEPALASRSARSLPTKPAWPGIHLSSTWLPSASPLSWVLQSRTDLELVVLRQRARRAAWLSEQSSMNFIKDSIFGRPDERRSSRRRSRDPEWRFWATCRPPPSGRWRTRGKLPMHRTLELHGQFGPVYSFGVRLGHLRDRRRPGHVPPGAHHLPFLKTFAARKGIFMATDEALEGAPPVQPSHPARPGLRQDPRCRTTSSVRQLTWWTISRVAMLGAAETRAAMSALSPCPTSSTSFGVRQAVRLQRAGVRQASWTAPAMVTNISLTLVFFPMMFPWLEGHPDVMKALPAPFAEGYAFIKAFCKREIAWHKEKLDFNNNEADQPEDFITAFPPRAGAPDPDSEHYFTDDDLCDIVADFFVAGTDTTAGALTWAALATGQAPGRAGQSPRAELFYLGDTILEKQARLPLHPAAFWDEVLRFCMLVPLNMRHSRRRATVIPADTVVGAKRLRGCRANAELFPNRDVPAGAVPGRRGLLLPQPAMDGLVFGAGQAGLHGREPRPHGECWSSWPALVQNFQLELPERSDRAVPESCSSTIPPPRPTPSTACCARPRHRAADSALHAAGIFVVLSGRVTELLRLRLDEILTRPPVAAASPPSSQPPALGLLRLRLQVVR
uniref:Protein kinase domain-containing protein n=1 Tax=Macrostomum lignano TaxID=282301 RepID=A0A1I8FPW8_9PLAT